MQRRSSAATARPESAEVEKAHWDAQAADFPDLPQQGTCTARASRSGLMCAGVEFAELDKVLSAYGQPNDPDLPQQWAMYKLGLFTSSHNINGVANAGAWNR